MDIKTVSYMVAALTLVGTAANACQKRWGFIIWMFTNLFWAVYNIFQGEYAQTIIYTINIIAAIGGWFKWGKEKKCSAD